jgi:hypothetical protein
MKIRRKRRVPRSMETTRYRDDLRYRRYAPYSLFLLWNTSSVSDSP